MSLTIFDNILREHEIKNEKRVAYIRMIPASVGILECLSYFDIAYLVPKPSSSAMLLSFFLLSYASITLILLLRNFHSKYFKYFVIFFDYVNVTATFFMDPTVTKQQSTILWFALVGTLFFYLLNLLRYSKEGTIFSGILSVIIYLGVGLNYQLPTFDIITLLFPLLIILIIGYSVTSSNKTMMVEANTKRMMERYLPPQLIGEFYKQNVNLEPGGRNQVVTILFSDIRSFTTISESMEAAEVVALLNEYLSSMTDIIFENQGTIDKFIGDAIMTIFGAPIQGKDDAIRAVKTAIFMKLALKEFNQKHPELKLPIEIGIGIHTGEVIAGNIGSEKRLDYTVIGDNVNLSSRIEGLTSHYKCPILVSESTYQAVSLENDESLFCFREVDKVRVKGKTKNIHVYEVMFYSSQEEKKKIHEIKNIFEFGLRLYRERKYQEAKSEWMKLPQDPLSAIYLERCDQYIASPPDDSWDGSFIMPTK